MTTFHTKGQNLFGIYLGGKDMMSTGIKPVMVSFFWAVVFGFTACTNNSERIVETAPTLNEDLGHLVFGATEDEKNLFFSNNTSIKLRDISSDKEHPIFEVINSDTETLRDNFPNARFIKNEFLQFADIKKPTLNLSQLSNLDLKLTSNTELFDLKSCLDDSLKPIAKMTPVSANLFSRTPLEIGAKIQISSQQSQPHAFVGGAIKKAWIIQAPQGSNVPEITFGNNLDVALDTMGLYQVYLLVQDKKRNCQFETINISVTGNTPFLGVANLNLDTSISNQPYLQKLGLNKAHLTSKGEGVLLAIVDSGVNYNNPYLSENIFINTNEIPDNGIDDDSNGLIDDVHGWDFVYNDKFPYDDLGHGSHVAGLAAGKVFGVAPNAKILPIKAGSNSGTLDLGTVFKAVIYALKMNADVINLSLGGERPALREELELYKKALNKNTLIVAAAGNGEPSPLGIFLGVDIDDKSYSPAGINLENILSVAALSNNNELAYYSNFGRQKINVATYGGEDFNLVLGRPYDGQLFSTYIENAKGELFFGAQGTSMAAPVAAGISCLVRSVNPNLSAGQTTRLLETAGPLTNSLRGKIKSGRILTADDAVEKALKSIQLLN